MKKDVAASAAGAVAPKKPEFSLIDEDLLKSRILHHPRGKGHARRRFGGDLRV